MTPELWELLREYIDLQIKLAVNSHDHAGGYGAAFFIDLRKKIEGNDVAIRATLSEGATT